MKKKFIHAHMCAAWIYAQLSYCKRRQVGCVIVKDERIISIGYNGTPSGWDNNCEDENNKTYPYVLHAETNAISKLARSPESGNGSIMFVTTNPCMECSKLIVQTGITAVYFSEHYRTEEGIVFLEKNGVLVEQVKKSDLPLFSGTFLDQVVTG